ncbi:MAG: glycosyltransferase family 2 protein [Treponemataceae bacterium]
MKKLSIITICYNEKDVEKTCKSIVDQKWQDFEWIVIDGGSDQWCLDLLEKYKYRMNYFITEPDNGIYDAMNKGILQATGEYLNFMNAGDAFIDNNVLSDIINNFSAEIIYGGEYWISEYNMIIKKINQKFDFSSSFFWSSAYWLRHQSAFIKKKLFDKYGLYDTQYISAADYEIFMRFIYKKKCSTQYINRIIDIYKAYDGLSSTTGNIGSREVEKIFLKNTPFFRRINIKSFPIIKQLVGRYITIRLKIDDLLTMIVVQNKLSQMQQEKLIELEKKLDHIIRMQEINDN